MSWSMIVAAEGAGLDDNGQPIFESFVMECAEAFRDGSGGITAAQTQQVFEAGSNNNAGFTSTLTSLYISGSNESGVPTFDSTTLSSFFDSVDFIGAVKDSASNWTSGWTCSSSTISFGNNTGSCTSLPVY